MYPVCPVCPSPRTFTLSKLSNECDKNNFFCRSESDVEAGACASIDGLGKEEFKSVMIKRFEDLICSKRGSQQLRIDCEGHKVGKHVKLISKCNTRYVRHDYSSAIKNVDCIMI